MCMRVCNGKAIYAHVRRALQVSDSKAKDRVLELVNMLDEASRTGSMPNRFDIDRGY